MIKQQPRSLTSRLAGMFGRYTAAEVTQQRRDPGTRIQSSDALLDVTKRKRVIEGARELWRNYSVAAWAVRKHLDFVSSFTFQANSQDAEFNQRLEDLMTWFSRSINCDVANRHSLSRMIRIAEARRLMDGDVFLIKVNGKLQAIEGDRVLDPQVKDAGSTWVHGIRLADGGRMMGAQIYKRSMDGNYTPERYITAGNIMQLAYWDSFDQYRGVSPMVAAIPEFQDCLEVKDYARAKAKVTQLFALAITREMADSDDEEESGGEYRIDLGKGPVKVELDAGDKMDFLESKHPSTEFQEFITLCLKAALKSIDIPWSFYDEAYTNFFGSRAALILYLKSVQSKRNDLIELLNRITVWKILQWQAQGVLRLPAGQTIDDISWDWIPTGMPWWNPKDEVAGDALAIQNKLRTRSEIRRERYGDDWRDVIRKLAEEEEFMRANGLDPATVTQPTGVPVSVATGDDQESDTPDDIDNDNENEDENGQ